jgi:hypothetical protein
MKLQKTFTFLFYLLAGIILGSLLANFCRGVNFLSWMGYAGTIGFAADHPALLDLLIIKVSFGFSVSVSVAQILTIGAAMYFYNRR